MSASLQRARPQIVGAADVVGDLAHRFEIAGRGDRKAGFDDVDAQIDQRLGDFQLFGQVHARAGRLLAVAQRGVENANRPRRNGHRGGLRSFLVRRYGVVCGSGCHGYLEVVGEYR